MMNGLKLNVKMLRILLRLVFTTCSSANQAGQFMRRLIFEVNRRQYVLEQYDAGIGVGEKSYRMQIRKPGVGTLLLSLTGETFELAMDGHDMLKMELDAERFEFLTKQLERFHSDIEGWLDTQQPASEHSPLPDLNKLGEF